MTIARLLIFTVLLVSAGRLSAGSRLWTDVSGRTIAAEFLTANEEHVFLRLKDGNETKVPLGRLANDSLEFVRKWREARLAKGIVFEAPLVWETYRSRSFTPAQAQQAGYYPIESDGTAGTLRIEFRRFGPRPVIPPGHRVVLRLTTPSRAGAGTDSKVQVTFAGKIAGTVKGAKKGKSFDIPLPAATLAGDDNIELEVTGGRDAVFVCSKNTGHGPRLLVVKK